jgi:hydrogenase-4 component E
MNIHILGPFLVAVLLLNFYILTTTQIRALVYAVAFQGVLLAVVYPVAHQQAAHAGADTAAAPVDHLAFVRLLVLAAVMMAVKGVVIPRLLLKAMREADVRRHVESAIGIVPTLLVGAVGTGLAMAFASTLPLKAEHSSNLIVPASLATMLTGFLILTTRWRALNQVLGYVVLENGIFIFGLLLVEALPILVELGVLLDLFVGVFVMAIIINHVSKAFPSASVEHLQTLRE